MPKSKSSASLETSQMDNAFHSEADALPLATGHDNELRPPRLAWAPLPVFFAIVIGLWLKNIQTPSETPELLTALNLILTTAPFLGIALLFLHSFLTTGAPGVALFGCGAVLWSASGSASLWPLLAPAGDAANIAVTIHNLIVWAASLSCLAGAALLLRGWPAIKERMLVLAAAYGLALAAAVFIAFAALKGWTPVFFVQGEGATAERQFVLGSTIFAILLTLSLLRKGITLRSPFLDWFSLASMLLAIGYGGLMMQTTMGGVLGWVSRAAQYSGGLYMLTAAYVAFRDTTPAFVVLAPSQDRTPHRYSIAIAAVLIAAVARLVSLNALGTTFGFITFYPAVMLAALYGGFRAGALATVFAAAIADYFWIAPAQSFAINSPFDWLAILIFVVNCLLISWIAELLQKAQARVRGLEADRRAELERLVAERTAELALANEAKTRLLAAATASEAELQAVFDAVPAGIWITRDPACSTMRGNRLGNGWMRISEGVNASKSAPGPSILRFEVFDKDGLPVPNDQLPMQRAGRGEEVMDYEFEWRFPDGESRSLYGNATPLRDEAGNVAGAVAAFINVTGRKRAEEALRESEERERIERHELEAILEAMPAAVFIAEDPACARMSLNRAGRELLRLSPDANASKSAPEGETPQHFEVYSKGRNLRPCELPLQRAAATKTAIEGAEFELRFVDGECKHFFGNALPLLDDEGEVRGAVGAFLDITDRKLAEDALRESEERLRHLGDSLPDSAVYRYGHEASGAPRFHYVSAGIEQLNGVSAEEVLRDASALHRQILPEYFSRLAEAERLSAREMSDFKMEIPMRRPDGELRWMRLQSRPHRTEDGRVIWDGVQTDITERKQAEAARRESEERFRGIYQHAETGIAITDLKGRFQSCNPAFSAMLGYTEQELLGLHFPELVHPEDREENVAVGAQLREQEIPSFDFLNRYIRKDGKAIWVHKRVSMLRDANGKPTHHIALATDMTERKRYEEHIGLLLKEVNHRAKNMLALVQAIARQTVAADPKDFVERFGERVRALAASQDLLVKAKWNGADLHELIRSQLAHFGDLIGARIGLCGPPLFISASAAQTIGMALHELATNAGKYGALSTSAGRVDIAWSLERDGNGEGRFELSWRESGGRPVSQPSRSGFGSTVICGMARMSLEADVDLDFAPGGLIWRLRCSSEKVSEHRT